MYFAKESEMGGQNHQPCNQYLSESTAMSRFASLAHLKLSAANIALEDVILGELCGVVGNVETIVSNLTASLGFLGDLGESITALERKMDEYHFDDLPSRRTIDYDALGMKLVDAGMIQEAAWQSAHKMGFRARLRVIEVNKDRLVEKTQRLLTAVSKLRPAAGDGKVNLILEENQSGNLKVEFARLYTEWATFNQFFLVSALVSTEEWYTYMGYGSMVGTTPLNVEVSV